MAHLGQLGQAAQFAAFLTAAGYDASYVAAANAAAQAFAAQQSQQQPLDASEDVGDDLEVGQYKVSKHSICKSVAGKVATDIRIGVMPSLVARGEAVAVAIKAIALACTFLAGNGVMLSCSPHHKNDGDNESGRTVILALKKVPAAPLELGTHLIKVAKKSRVEGIAGSIAHTVRKGEVVCMQALGPDCIGLAIDAIVVARRMLKRDTGFDVCFIPKFISLEPTIEKLPGEKKPSAIQFHLFSMGRLQK
jgi:stage V sporulation protein SpoVS